MQSNLCVHTKYENMDKIYLYPIWEYFSITIKCRDERPFMLYYRFVIILLSDY